MASKAHPKILVTGATGSVGSCVAAALIEKGVPFRAGVHNLAKATNSPPFNTNKAKDLVDFAEMELYNPATIEKAFHGIEKVFLLTPPGQTHTSYPLIEAAKKAGVKYIVKLSALGVDEPEQFTWAADHLAVEEAIHKAGIALTSLRPSYFFSNVFAYVPTIKAQNMIAVGLQDARLNTIDNRDIGEAAVVCLTHAGHEGKTYYLTGPDTLNHWEMADLFSEVLGKPITYVPLDDKQLRDVAKTFLPEQAIDGFANMFLYFRNGGYNRTFPHLEQLLGHKGRHFKPYLQENAAAFK